MKMKMFLFPSYFPFKLLLHSKQRNQPSKLHGLNANRNYFLPSKKVASKS